MSKNWCFQIVVLEKILESPSDCRGSNLSILKEINPELSLEGLIAEAKAPIPDAKSRLIGKDPDAGKDWQQKEKRVAEDEMVREHHGLHEHEFKQTPGDSKGQGSLECGSPWRCKESDMA